MIATPRMQVVTFPTSEPDADRLSSLANARRRSNRSGRSIGRTMSATSYQCRSAYAKPSSASASRTGHLPQASGPWQDSGDFPAPDAGEPPVSPDPPTRATAAREIGGVIDAFRCSWRPIRRLPRLSPTVSAANCSDLCLPTGAPRATRPIEEDPVGSGRPEFAHPRVADGRARARGPINLEISSCSTHRLPMRDDRAPARGWRPSGRSTRRTRAGAR